MDELPSQSKLRSRLLVDAAHSGILGPAVAEVGSIPGVSSRGCASWSRPRGANSGSQRPTGPAAGSLAAVGGGEQQHEPKRNCRPHFHALICTEKKVESAGVCEHIVLLTASMRRQRR